jgi:hypothetical protein
LGAPSLAPRSGWECGSACFEQLGTRNGASKFWRAQSWSVCALMVCGAGARSVFCAGAGLWLESNQTNRHIGRVKSLGRLCVCFERHDGSSRDWNCCRLDLDWIPGSQPFLRTFRDEPENHCLLLALSRLPLDLPCRSLLHSGLKRELCSSAVRHVLPDCSCSATRARESAEHGHTCARNSFSLYPGRVCLPDIPSAIDIVFRFTATKFHHSLPASIFAPEWSSNQR